jgi:hypothetical protein
LLWSDVQVWFDPDLNGTLPDVHVPDTTVEDWRALVDLVQSEGWQFTYQTVQISTGRHELSRALVIAVCTASCQRQLTPSRTPAAAASFTR